MPERTVNPVPATAAPSQPARECEAFVVKFARDRHVKFPETWDFIYELLDAYLAQQSAAKDAEIERLTAIAGDLTDRNDALTDESCKLQDDVAAIVSSHRSDWSWDDVLSDVRNLKAAERERDSLRDALKELTRERDKYKGDAESFHAELRELHSTDVMRSWRRRALAAEAENAALKAGKE